MAEKITIEMLAESEKAAFAKALENEELTDKERAFLRDAGPSWDYILSFLSGTQELPKPEEDSASELGMRWGFLKGSILNIVMAENIAFGEWSNLTEMGDDGEDDSEKQSPFDKLKCWLKTPLGRKNKTETKPSEPKTDDVV